MTIVFCSNPFIKLYPGYGWHIDIQKEEEVNRKSLQVLFCLLCLSEGFLELYKSNFRTVRLKYLKGQWFIVNKL
jgi:hypothetical protein